MEFTNMNCSDYPAVYDLWKNTPGMGLNDVDDSEPGIRSYLSRNPNTCFVAKEDDRVVGVILAGHDGRRGYIHHAAVVVEKRGRGIGSALLDAALDALKKEGISKVCLVVFKHNAVGNEFWEKRGFQIRDDLNYRNLALTELKRIDI